jgi:hypothetical protein
MADTIMSLFKQKQGEIFDLQSKVLIETRGVVDAKRTAALALASPNTVAGLVGSTAAGLIGGNANRPSDTIFPSPKVLAKPVSLTRPTQALLQNAIDPDKDYYVKQHPSPALLGPLSHIKNIVTNPGAAQSAAIGVLNKYGGKGAAKRWLDGLKGNNNFAGQYGKKYSLNGRGKPISDTEDILYSTHYKVGEKLIERKKTQYTGDGSLWDRQNDNLILLKDDETTNKIKEFIDKDQKIVNTPYVLFKVYGDTNANRQVILPATVTGISEEITPSINTFKYVGSPFNLYRYNGTERIIRFELKLYYTTEFEKKVMQKKLNLLKEYAFPDRNLTTIQYQNGNYSPITFNPNILQFTINGLYNDLYCMMESLSLTIDDNVTWPSLDGINPDGANLKSNGAKEDETAPYPSVINVSISLKIIEHPSVKVTNGISTYNYEGSDVEGNKYTNYFTNNNI